MIDYVELKNLHRRNCTGVEFVGKLRRIIQPTLLITGRFDYIALLSNQKKLQKILPDAKLVIFNHSTHAAHIEEKRKFIKELNKFIKE